MGPKIRDFLRHWESLDFGESELSSAQDSFYCRFNNEMVSLCRSLPKSAQTDGILFLMRYSRIKPGDELNFFASYYPPAWSILYWLSHDSVLPIERLNEQDVTNSVTAHSMAMFLHSLDDHLCDGQIPVTPLTLLLRSQVWSIMSSACSDLAKGVPDGERTVRRFIDDYYSSNQDSKELKSLDSYCDLFRRQMAIWMIAPILLSMKMTGTSDFARDIEIAYGSFGIAWRLLDDLKDIADDIGNGAHSAIYVCLPEQMRSIWEADASGSAAEAGDSPNAVLEHILEHGLVDKIRERICVELETATSLVEAHHMAGLAREFRCLAGPLRDGGMH